MKLIILTTSVLATLSASSAYAVPMCDGPDFRERGDGGQLVYSEEVESQTAELQLRSMGIDANNARFWQGCIQTFVTDASGHTQMRFYDPNTYRQIPAN